SYTSSGRCLAVVLGRSHCYLWQHLSTPHVSFKSLAVVLGRGHCNSWTPRCASCTSMGRSLAVILGLHLPGLAGLIRPIVGTIPCGRPGAGPLKDRQAATGMI